MRKKLALLGVIILLLLFLSTVIVGIFFKNSFELFIGLIIATTLFAAFIFAILLILKNNEDKE